MSYRCDSHYNCGHHLDIISVRSIKREIGLRRYTCVGEDVFIKSSIIFCMNVSGQDTGVGSTCGDPTAGWGPTDIRFPVLSPEHNVSHELILEQRLHLHVFVFYFVCIVCFLNRMPAGIWLKRNVVVRKKDIHIAGNFAW